MKLASVRLIIKRFVKKYDSSEAVYGFTGYGYESYYDTPYVDYMLGNTLTFIDQHS